MTARWAKVAELIRKFGYEPVWKDWDAALTGHLRV